MKPERPVVALVACSGAKIATPRGAWVEARELYMASDLFAKSRAWVEAALVSQGGSWAILSALHGLLPPSRPIQSYEVALARMPAAERRAWAQRTAEQIREAWPLGAHFVVLAGAHYRAVLPLTRECSWVVPMEGLGIGQQKQWLGQQLAHWGRR